MSLQYFISVTTPSISIIQIENLYISICTMYNIVILIGTPACRNGTPVVPNYCCCCWLYVVVYFVEMKKRKSFYLCFWYIETFTKSKYTNGMYIYDAYIYNNIYRTKGHYVVPFGRFDKIDRLYKSVVCAMSKA